MARPVEYTQDFIREELKLLLDTLKSNKEIVYIGELFEEKDYPRQRYSEWVDKYKDDDEIKRLSDTIKSILETRAIKGAMTNKLNPTATIFHLKNNYKWVDKQEIEQNVKGELKVNSVKQMSDDELLNIAG